MSATDPSAAGTAAANLRAAATPRALRERLVAMASEWRELLARDWQPAHASALHEELERLVSQADTQGLNELADPAMELTVFLCSFVESGLPPGPAQRNGLEALLQGLLQTLGAAPPAAAAGSPAAAPEPPPAKARQALYLRSGERANVPLSRELGKRGYVVKPVESIDSTLAALAERVPEVVLVDDEFMSQVHTVNEAIDRLREVHRDAPLCLVLAVPNDDPARVLFAQRAGADAVVDPTEPLRVLARIEELTAARNNLGYRVLVVEDDRGQGKFCESVLRHRGIQTHLCLHPREVLPALNEFRPDLVLLDLYLPETNGIEVAQHIRNEPGHAFLPIVFLSGEQDLDRRFDAISMGGDDFLTKPVKPRHLLMTVESRVRRARALAVGGPTGAPVTSERRGTLSGREPFVRDVLHAAAQNDGQCIALAMLQVDGIENLRERVGFVAGGELGQQLAAAVAVELPFARPLCAAGEYTYLAMARANDALAMREQLEAARSRLAKRSWLSSEHPLAVEFTLSATLVPAGLRDLDALVLKLRRALQAAQNEGGARCALSLVDPSVEAAAEDPQERVVRALLRAPNSAASMQLAYHPLQPIRGQMHGQFALRATLKPPGSTRGIALERAACLEIARKHGQEGQLDRHVLRAAISALAQQGARAAELRLFVPVCAASLRDTAFAPWLAAELRARDLSSGTLALQFDASDLASAPPSEAAVDAIERVGVRLCINFDRDDAETRRQLTRANFGLLRLSRPQGETNWDNVAPLQRQMIELGKIVIAAGIDDPREFAQLLKLNPHYAEGDALCGWLAKPEFEFENIV